MLLVQQSQQMPGDNLFHDKHTTSFLFVSMAMTFHNLRISGQL